MLDRLLLEPGGFGQQGRRAFELLAGDPRHLLAAAVLRLGARGGAGARLAGGGLGLARLGELRLGRVQRLLAGALVGGGGLGGLGGGDGLGGHRLDLRVERGRRLGQPLRFGFRLGGAAGEFGVALLGLGGAGPPVGLLLARRFGPLPVGADRLGMGRGLGADLGQSRLRAFGLGAKLGDPAPRSRRRREARRRPARPRSRRASHR